MLQQASTGLWLPDGVLSVPAGLDAREACKMVQLMWQVSDGNLAHQACPGMKVHSTVKVTPEMEAMMGKKEVCSSQGV